MCKLLDGAENIEAGLPTFHNLTHLHVRPDHYFPGAYTVGALMYLLQKAPKLETLSIVSVSFPCAKISLSMPLS